MITWQCLIAIVAFVLAAIELARSAGRSLTSWAVVLLAIILASNCIAR